MDMPRAKRQRVFANEPTPVSFTDKLANWLLPSKPAAGAVGQPFSSANVSDAPATTSYPFKQQQQQQSVDKRRLKKSIIGARPKLQKTPSVLQSFEHWLFTDPENKAPN